MKYILIICLVFGGYSVYSKYQANKFESELGSSVVKIYGNDSCKYTKATLSYLESAGIEYQYRNIENTAYYTEMLSKMESHGMNTNRIEIPTLEIGGKLFVDPTEDVISTEYNSSKI